MEETIEKQDPTFIAPQDEYISDIPGLTQKILDNLESNRIAYYGAPTVLEALQRLKRKFPEMVIENGTLKFWLPEVTIEWEGNKVDFGKYRFEFPLLDWAKFNYSPSARGELLCSLYLFCQDQYALYTEHPHVQGGAPCLGEATAPLTLAIWQLRFDDAADICYSMLCTYNPSSPFKKISYWITGEDEDEYFCSSCGESIEDFYFEEMCEYCFDDSEETFRCERCGDLGYTEDGVYISEEYYCDSCAEKVGSICHECGQWFHKNCSVEGSNGVYCSDYCRFEVEDEDEDKDEDEDEDEKKVKTDETETEFTGWDDRKDKNNE